MRRTNSDPDWGEWLRRWDAQQESFNPERERRFSAMFDVVEAKVGRRFVALDLGSGPGSLSARLLRRFPRARCVAVDFDPVALRVGQGALGSFGGRLRWVDTRLGRSGWTDQLPAGRYDAVLSTTALHWLAAADLRQLYRDLYGRMRKGGVFLDGDRLSWGVRHRELSRLAESVRRLRFRGASLDSEWAAWRKWWEDAEKLPELRPLFQARKERQSQHPKEGDLPLDAHVRALRHAGFRDVAVVWQDLENRVLFAAR
ncbi:MAG: class I SAM-dependent methyltransferase [Thermoplasmata archaeon]